MIKNKTAVVALGGNAIGATGKEDIHEQFANTRKSLVGIIELIRDGYNLAITHGNGPQVGNALLRVERTTDVIPPLPLGVIVADTEGGMGYMIEQSLQNRLQREKIKREVATIVTQVVVAQDDPSLLNPSKPIGPYYTKEEAEALVRERGWVVKEDAGRGYRRFVSSPIPKEIVNKKIIKQLVHSGIIVIAAGGGGIPVYVEKDGTYEGVDAVVDKDRASAVLARDISAETLMILTSVEKVAINYHQTNQKDLSWVRLEEIKDYYKDGQFAPGSMGPKIEAAIQFLESGGKQVVITSLDKVKEALEGRAGTKITK
ncbi:MAG: carbamate kinase [Candidatus Edwardsbacteria bacterium]